MDPKFDGKLANSVVLGGKNFVEHFVVSHGKG